ncbi:MAG: alpha/beta fold hydrolase [Candidatus Aminicenantales bacterium]
MSRAKAKPRKRFSRAVLKSAAGIILLVSAGIGYLLLTRPSTPPVRGTDGRRAPDSIAALEKVTLGGVEQAILVRGASRTNPVLLFLHGGPGLPGISLARKLRLLEQDFTVVCWDQKGAGKSYQKGLDPSALTPDRLASEAGELAAILGTRFHQPAIYLAGHSWGAYLGMRVIARHPERFRAFVGIGQLVDAKKTRDIQEQFIRTEAQKRGEDRAVREVEEKGPAVYEKWVLRFGGMLYGKHNLWPLVRTMLAAPEYSLKDLRNSPKGYDFSRARLGPYLAGLSLADEVAEVRVPVFFFSGIHDYCAPAGLVETYFETLRAPAKDLIWFERSAHFPFIEEPEKFRDAMRKVLEKTMTD